MNYIGEHLLPGQIGHFFSLLFLVSAGVATVAFFMASKNSALVAESVSWQKIARKAFLVETFSVLALFGTLYYIISHHYFEYKYAFNHSDKSLQIEYLLSCFWEGQEGSFMLWSFWHCVLGWFFIRRKSIWENGVLGVINLAQFCLATMLIGLYFFNAKVGSSPFILLRHDTVASIFSNPNYLQMLGDGKGLNTLLQNYWMVIHPPILFLGFASTIIPFALAITGLLSNRHEWTGTALSWTGFSAAILGLGVMMGAAWAYESLSFGGYWAWDPVENASLVPWLTLVAGLHTNMIYKNSGYSLRPTYFFYIISFCLILYSTFLTRSGILGDTSVHAFTDLEMNTQLLLFLFVFLIPALVLYAFRYRGIPSIAKEEDSYSREFWLFIGSLVLFLAGIVIIAKTSVPVFNKVFGTKIAPPEDTEYAYNQIQIFVAIVIGILSAITQYLKYKTTPRAYLGKHIWLPTAIAIVISLSISFFGDINFTKKGMGFLWAIHVGIFAAVYSVVANFSYIWLVLKGKIKAAGASVAHVGFGLMLVGILISSSKKTVLSWNTTGITPLSANSKGSAAGDPAENITLFKGLKTDMGKFWVTYQGDSINPLDRKRYFDIHFTDKQGKESFSLYPDVIKQNKGGEGFAANPAAKHYWNKDIFAYITSFQENNQTDTSTFQPRTIRVGDTLFYSSGWMRLDSVSVNPASRQSLYANDETAVFLNLTLEAKNGSRYPAHPGMALKANQWRPIVDTVVAQSVAITFNRVLDEKKGLLEIGVKQSASITSLLTLKVYEFPMINLLWLGTILMVIGFFLSVWQRIRFGKTVRSATS
ncbi:MAG: cytochrome c biogenesis protein CcsA [Bacteroidetes bacterium]|nr:cytochrome c biogenesis protein CcsA [Bacteroidota bacterium]